MKAKLHQFRRYGSLLGLVALTAVAGACGDDDDVTGPGTDTADFRVAHSSPDVPAVDIYVNGGTQPVFENLGYGQVTEYVAVPASAYTVQVRAAGAGSTSVPMFETGAIALGGGDVLTAVAAGLLGSSADDDRFRVLGLYEGFAAPASGSARVRVVHASPDAPSVDIDVGRDGSAEITDIGRFEDTGATGVDLPGGTPLSIGVNAAGGAEVTSFTIPSLAAGTEYFVIATGLLGRPADAADGFVLLAVDETGSAAIVRQDGPSSGLATVRAVHASPDAPAVDIYAEGLATPLLTGVAFGETTPYVTVPAGTYNLQLRAAGADPSTDPAYETGALSLPGGVTVTGVAAGFLGSAGAADAFRILPLVEAFGAPAAGSARVRILHASPDAPTVDIDIGDDGTPEILALERFADTGESGVDLPAGATLQVGVDVHGGGQFTAFTTPSLPDGGELFLIATGSTAAAPRADDGFGILAVGPTGTIGFTRQNPRVYALHGGPDAPSVDVFAGEAALIENLSFGGLAGVQVPPGSYTLDFYATGAGPGAPAASADTPELAAGGLYLAVAAGELVPEGSEAPFGLIAVEELFEPTDAARVRVVHASGDAPPVDVGTSDGQDVTAIPDFTGLAFGETSPAAGTEVPVGDLTIGVAPTGTTPSVADFDVGTFAGMQTFAVAVGALAPDVGEEAFRIVLVPVSEGSWSAVEVLPNP
ncbi:MAG: DUF4397 domain-containing protein [Gemmatimonadota bacterium]